MARKHSFTVQFLLAVVCLTGSGCALFKDATSSVASSQPVPTPTNPDQPTTTEPDPPKISVKIRTGSTSQSLKFDGPYATLGDVLSTAKIASDPKKVIAVLRHTNVIYLPSYFATNTDAAKIAIEDDDEVACVALETSPLATDKLAGFRASLKAAFPTIYPENVTPTIEILHDSLEVWNEALTAREFDEMSESDLKKNIAAANKMISNFKTEPSREGLVGRYSISGIIQKPGVRQLTDVKTIDEILSNELAIVNNVPANIIVLQRGNTISVLPFRDALRTGTVPANVMSDSTNAWTKATVLNGDSYQFTRLALFAPVVDGFKKETERKTSKRLSAVAKDAMKDAESYYKEIEKQSRRKEPGPLRKALRSLPNQLPDFKFPGFRLPGF